jgi:hypothetical protein
MGYETAFAQHYCMASCFVKAVLVWQLHLRAVFAGEENLCDDYEESDKPCCYASWDSACSEEQGDQATCEDDGVGSREIIPGFWTEPESGVWCPAGGGLATAAAVATRLCLCEPSQGKSRDDLHANQAAGRPKSYLGDDWCDTKCNVAECNFDDGDCDVVLDISPIACPRGGGATQSCNSALYNTTESRASVAEGAAASKLPNQYGCRESFAPIQSKQTHDGVSLSNAIFHFRRWTSMFLPRRSVRQIIRLQTE